MKKLFTFLIFVIIYSNSIAQVSQEWVRTYNGSAYASDEGKKIVTDTNGNVFVAGVSKNLYTSFDYLTIKYNNLGIQQWIKVYSGGGYNDDYINAMTLDNSGNVYVTGSSYSSENNTDDYLTIKYDSNGIEQWTARFNGPANGQDWAYGIATDDSENVYVTGQCYGSIITNWDYGTVKYNKNGIQQWVALYNGMGNTNDRAIEIKIDINRNVYITGDVSANNNYDITTVKYNSSGTIEWFERYNGSANGFDLPTSMDIDTLGNVYVTGCSDSIGTGNDFVTLKYNTNGNLSWITKYNGSSNSGDISHKIKVLNPDCIFITGYCSDIGKGKDIVTIKYNCLGITQWASKYSGFTSSQDVGYDLAVDKVGSVYTTGESSNDCITIKYNPSGNEQWVQTYNGTCNKSIAVDNLGNVNVTGYGAIQNQGSDIITINYSQTPQIRININLLFEGMYSTSFNQLTRKETVTAYLHQSIAPFNIIDSAKCNIDTILFSGIFKFFHATSDTYYISVKHLNSIATWSKSKGEYLTNSGTLYNYDFTSSNTQAYGDNLILKGSKYCLYSGDVNQDGFITLYDVIPIYNDSKNFVTGRYLVTDINGDNVVDLTDMTVCSNNSKSFIRVMRP